MANKQKPSALKHAEGTWRADRVAANEPEAIPMGCDDAPGTMTPDAARFWREYLPILSAMGVLSKSDRSALAEMCECHAEIVRLRGVLAGLGETVYEIETVAGGLMRRPHPEFAQISDLSRQLRSWMTDFGLTPASRSKVSKIVERKVSKFDKLGPVPIRNAG
jgi:P27 family predicted phage terminase small subunit